MSVDSSRFALLSLVLLKHWDQIAFGIDRNNRGGRKLFRIMQISSLSFFLGDGGRRRDLIGRFFSFFIPSFVFKKKRRSVSKFNSSLYFYICDEQICGLFCLDILFDKIYLNIFRRCQFKATIGMNSTVIYFHFSVVSG